MQTLSPYPPYINTYTYILIFIVKLPEYEANFGCSVKLTSTALFLRTASLNWILLLMTHHLTFYLDNQINSAEVWFPETTLAAIL